jgi:hypothetical protein
VNFYEKNNEVQEAENEDVEDAIQALDRPLKKLKTAECVRSSVPFTQTHASFPLSTNLHHKSNDTCGYVEELITKYVKVVRGQVSDFVPKCIMFHMFDCCLNGKFKDAIVSSCSVLHLFVDVIVLHFAYDHHTKSPTNRRSSL